MINNEEYKHLLQNTSIQAAYEFLLRFMGKLKAELGKIKNLQVGSISPGFLDYSYVAFRSAFIGSRQLRFGIVLNHKELRFELWLMGQNANIQALYWEKLKDYGSNQMLKQMPKYSVYEEILMAEPDFTNEKLRQAIITRALERAQQIEKDIKNTELNY